jgi:hypothetical protein
MQKPSLFQQQIRRISRPESHARFAASAVTERNVTQGVDWSALYRDRYSYDRERILSEALLAWRLNPLARRIVEIQTQYVTDGIDFHCDDERAEQFLREFWNHPLNRIGAHLAEWSDELALTGNLFVSLTTDRAGMSYLRVHPTDLIAEIETAANDVQQELSYVPKATASNPDPKAIPSYWAVARDHRANRKSTISNQKSPAMLHYAVNRLSGMLWGEPDLAPLLPWLARYANWLEDRMRLNRFRQAYLYVVKGQYASEAERVARQQQLLASPPQPGSILVTDASEEWGVISPMLDSTDANSDGLALKKFIAGGRGYPLHWLAEPESSTRTTAEAAGTPTFKGLESRQKMFLSMVKDILQVVLQRSNVPTFQRAHVSVDAADISERDNAALALASTQVVASFGQLWAGGLIETDEYLRVVYRFAGEVLPSARPDAPRTQAAPQPHPAKGVSVDAGTGDVTTREE